MRKSCLVLVLCLGALGAQAQTKVAPDVPAGAARAHDAELAKRAAGIIDAFVNTAPAFTPDGKKVVFSSNRDGLPQLPPAPPELAPGSSTTEPVTGAPSSAVMAWRGITRGYQSLNPDIAVIVDTGGGYYSDEDRFVKSGDDPGQSGFNLQELELAFQAVVDPYLRADIFLTIPNLSGLEVEEAFATTTHLPANLQLKAGVFRAGLGRQNTQHLHVQDFTRRPRINSAFFGIDGLRSPGVELNWLVPRLPFYLLLAASAFTVRSADPDRPVESFGGGAWYDFTYVGLARVFLPLTEDLSLYTGINFAAGKTSQVQAKPDAAQVCMSPGGSAGKTPCDGARDYLYGLDLYLKWKPSSVARTYASLAWQTEYFVRHTPSLRLGGASVREVEGGIYSQLVAQVTRRWFLGVRGEVLGIPSGDLIGRDYAAIGSVTFALSEFARARVYGESRFPAGQSALYSTFVQLEASIGAHGAHPF